MKREDVEKAMMEIAKDAVDIKNMYPGMVCPELAGLSMEAIFLAIAFRIHKLGMAIGNKNVE